MDWWKSEWWTALLDRLRGRSTDRPPLPSPGVYWPGSGPSATYATIYRTQPHVRTVVDFLAQQLGQLGIHVFRRLSDTDRVRVHDHPLAKLLRAPNEGTTRYTFIAETITDWCVYGNAYAIKLRRPNRMELYRVPPPLMQPHGDLIPRAYTWTVPGGQSITLDAADVFHLRDYNPEDPVLGLSRLETLRKLLAEDAASVRYREWFWNNGAKLSGWIKRPREAPRWNEEQRQQFRDEWGQFQGPANAGKTAVLEDGMEFNPVTATARESELVDARKLTREEVAAAFHVPPAMLGILEAQGYGSLREQHKALYQDTLGPTVSLLEGEIERQLLTEFSDSDDVYVQMNIAEKLQGSFEEEVSAMGSAVGSPWMTRNEARARANLPRINDASFDTPVTRLDIAEGQNAKNGNGNGNGNGLPPAASAPMVWVEPAPPQAIDLDPIAARIERALRVLPAELAARLPTPPRPTSITKARRDERGHIVGLDEFDAEGNLLRHRALIRDEQGRTLELADAVADVESS